VINCGEVANKGNGEVWAPRGVSCGKINIWRTLMEYKSCSVKFVTHRQVDYF
jgi:hypothetical protein